MTPARPLGIRTAVPADDAARDAFVREHRAGTFFHLSGWSRVIEHEMGHKRRDLLAFRGGTLAGVLPLMSCKGLGWGRSLIAMPNAVYGGALGETRTVEHALFREAERLAVAEGVGRLELRCLEDPGLDLPGSELYATFVRKLPGRSEEVLAGMPKKARAEARKAREEYGLKLSTGSWHVRDLATMFHRNKHSLGSPGLPLTLFESLIEVFPDEVAVHLVRHDAEPVAAVMSFLFGDKVMAYYSGTAKNADRSYSASNFMYMALQEWCVERGYGAFDFGRSRKNSGAYQFKLHQGFEPRDVHYRYRLVKDHSLPSLTPSNPRTRVLQDAWRMLPLWLTKRLSTPVSRYLP